MRHKIIDNRGYKIRDDMPDEAKKLIASFQEDMDALVEQFETEMKKLAEVKKQLTQIKQNGEREILNIQRDYDCSCRVIQRYMVKDLDVIKRSFEGKTLEAIDRNAEEIRQKMKARFEKTSKDMDARAEEAIDKMLDVYKNTVKQMRDLVYVGKDAPVDNTDYEEIRNSFRSTLLITREEFKIIYENLGI